MSHFSVLVILPSNTKPDQAKGQIARLLAPYDENMTVAPHDTDCYCMGLAAQTRAREAVEAQGLNSDDFRDRYNNVLTGEERRETSWSDFIKPYLDAIEAAKRAQPDFEKPDPDCEECSGTGVRDSVYNPDSKWDWYEVGGRWTGALTGYDPEIDPANIETCSLCGGTGKRLDMVVENGCNGCQGKGTRTKWPTQWAEYEQDILPVKAIRPDFGAYAVVTPDGEWHERGEMGWFGMASNEKDEGAWEGEYKALLAPYQENLAAVVDCHI